MEYHPLPQPQDLPEREKEDAMGAYLMMFAAIAVGLPLPIINLIASIIYYFVNRKKSRFIHFHCAQALWSQIPTTVINWIAVIWAATIVLSDQKHPTPEFWAYVMFAGICTLIYFVIGIIAAYKARHGKMYYMLVFGKIAYQSAYRVRQERHDGDEPVNKPPF